MGTNRAMSTRAAAQAREVAYGIELAKAKVSIYGGLDPVDIKRCQGEFKNPQNPFKLGDPPARWQRCDRVPVAIAIESKSDPLTKTRGAMSLCRSCEDLCRRERPGEIYIPAAPFKAAFRLGGHQAVFDMVRQVPEV